MTKQEIIALQTSLREQGYPVVVDGIYGPQTRDAYSKYLDKDTNVPTVVPLAVKPWWQSRAVLGLLATILVGLARRYGLEVDQGGLTDVLLQVAEVAGVALAFYGTVKRSAPLDSGLVLPGVRIKPTGGVPSQGKSDPGSTPGPFGY